MNGWPAPLPPLYPFAVKRRGWRKWIVVYLEVRRGKGREVARFSGKFAYYRAERRAKRLQTKWRDRVRPIIFPAAQKRTSAEGW